MYCDPRDWQTEIDAWSLQYGEKIVVQWPTNQIGRMWESLDRYYADLLEGTTTHSDDLTFKVHALNARKIGKPGDKYILGKPADRAEAVAMLQQLSGRTHQSTAGP